MFQVSVVTYNVLSPNLISAHTFERDPQYLDEKYRLSLLFQEFEIFITNERIIGLQEVSKKWSEEFFVFFSNRNYNFYWAKGQDFRSGYMGPAFAWPKKFKLEKIESFQVSSLIVPPNKSSEEKVSPKVVSRTQRLKDWVAHKLMNYFMGSRLGITENKTIDSPVPVDERAMAIKKYNEALIATFSHDDRKFLVVNYHMPCAFAYPLVMRLHVEALRNLVESRSNSNLPVILLGDFNSTPDSEVYKMITSKFENINSSLTTCKSLYKYETMTSPMEFTGTIDYIFTKRFRLEEVDIKIIDCECIPNKNYPSDHVPVSASFSFL